MHMGRSGLKLALYLSDDAWLVVAFWPYCAKPHADRAQQVVLALAMNRDELKPSACKASSQISKEKLQDSSRVQISIAALFTPVRRCQLR